MDITICKAPIERHNMQPYANNGGNSSVTAFEIDLESITVEFKGGVRYSYTYQSAGSQHIEEMKALAQAGQGLGAYIMRNVRQSYASRF